MATHTLVPVQYWQTFGPNQPALKVKSGDRIIAKTRDARGFDAEHQPLPESQRQSSPDTEYLASNPLVGPIYVEGAEPGDVVAVHIEAIELTRPSAWSRIVPHFGSLTGEVAGRRLLLNEPLPEAYFEWELDLARGVARLSLAKSRVRAVEIPIDPFIGSIGVAPRYGRVETAMAPGEFGGNMDCGETRVGTTLYLPVWVRGAFLAFGDVHAAQGDGELCGVALETSARVTLRLEVLKGWPGGPIAWPRLIDADWIMVAGSSRPLMEALQIAHVELLSWLVEGYGFDRAEGWQVLSQVGRIRIGNVVDPNFTVVAKFPRRLLPEAG